MYNLSFSHYFGWQFHLFFTCLSRLYRLTGLWASVPPTKTNTTWCCSHQVSVTFFKFFLFYNFYIRNLLSWSSSPLTVQIWMHNPFINFYPIKPPQNLIITSIHRRRIHVGNTHLCWWSSDHEFVCVRHGIPAVHKDGVEWVCTYRWHLLCIAQAMLVQ